MRCDEARDNLAEFAVGGLDEPSRSALQAHLEACADCRKEREALLATGRLLDTTELLRPSRDLWPDVAAALRGRKRVRAPWWQLEWIPHPRWAIAVATTAAAAAAIALALFLPHPAHAPQIATAIDEDAAIFARWNAGAALEGGFADAHAFAVLLQETAAAHEEAGNS